MAKCSSAQKSFKGGWEWGRAGGVVVFLYRYTNGVGWVLGLGLAIQFVDPDVFLYRYTNLIKIT